MRTLLLGAIVGLCVSAASAIQAQVPNPQVLAPINTFMEAFNKGDMAGAAATHAAGPDLAITDEVAPFQWRGAQAFQTWAADLARNDKQAGATDQKVVLSAPTRVESDGTAAYVIVPAVYTFKEKCVAMRESAQMTFTLKKDASGWLIDGWTWTGPRARKVATAAGK